MEMLENMFVLYEFFQIDWYWFFDGIPLLNAGYLPSCYVELNNMIKVGDQRVWEHKVLSITSYHNDSTYLALIYSSREILGADVLSFEEFDIYFWSNKGVNFLFKGVILDYI
jgi:hypothetical protein